MKNYKNLYLKECAKTELLIEENHRLRKTAQRLFRTLDVLTINNHILLSEIKDLHYGKPELELETIAMIRNEDRPKPSPLAC